MKCTCKKADLISSEKTRLKVAGKERHVKNKSAGLRHRKNTFPSQRRGRGYSCLDVALARKRAQGCTLGKSVSTTSKSPAKSKLGSVPRAIRMGYALIVGYLLVKSCTFDIQRD